MRIPATRSRFPLAIVSDDTDTWRDVRHRYKHVSVDHRFLEVFSRLMRLGAYVRRYDRVNDDFKCPHSLSTRLFREVRRSLCVLRERRWGS